MVPQHLYQALGLTLLLIVGPTSAEEKRNPDWARPLEVKGTKNAFRVSPILYRSAQPTALGFLELKKIGIRIISIIIVHYPQLELGSNQFIIQVNGFFHLIDGF